MIWTENLCRLCGNINPNSHSIFKLLSNNETVEYKIKKCLNINIYKEDYKPKEICDQCIGKIEQFSEFLDVCLLTNEKFDSILKNSWSEVKDLSMPDYEPKSVIVNMKDTIVNEILPINDVLDIVENTNVYSAQDILYYPDCSNTVRHSSNIEMYTNFNYDYAKINEETQFVNEIVPKNKPKAPLISVEEIKKQINYQPDCNNVKVVKVKKKHQCPYCDKVFMQRLSLNSHIAVHTKNKPYVCSICSKTFPIKSELTIHKKIHSDQYQCKICLKTFVVPSKLQRHLRTHTKEKPFKCKNCNKSFSDRSNLTEHENTHRLERNLKCEKCDKFFKTKSQLKSHKLSHNLNVSFTCDICKVSYKYKTNLILHMKKHTGYLCPFCNLNCEKLNVLIRHRKECNKR